MKQFKYFIHQVIHSWNLLPQEKTGANCMIWFETGLDKLVMTCPQTEHQLYGLGSENTERTMEVAAYWWCPHTALLETNTGLGEPQGSSRAFLTLLSQTTA